MFHNFSHLLHLFAAQLPGCQTVIVVRIIVIHTILPVRAGVRIWLTNDILAGIVNMVAGIVARIVHMVANIIAGRFARRLAAVRAIGDVMICLYRIIRMVYIGDVRRMIRVRLTVSLRRIVRLMADVQLIACVQLNRQIRPTDCI